ncbi:phospholipid-transporting ATPase VA-like [Gigantopelta aegis]|uniref:phospholipid-transporting ATPase VA-like n=1 Tax=Gigantopelta aegis TaxID=1735272 RepID=UPI001B88A1DD|nr:phospholipid-transporting ATPase VA-like [Gigantopelta aegis]
MGNIFQRNSHTGPNFRIVVPNHTVPDDIPINKKNHPNYGYCTNNIKTTKYTILTFLPKNLFEQFHRFANLYFIFVVCLNWVPEVQAFGKEIAMVPVVFVLLVTAVKDAYEDFRRYRSDNKINNQTCRIFCRKEKRYIRTIFSKVYAGDFIHLSCNEEIPADILLLKTSDSMGMCHIETSNLDGENNLKQRQIISCLQDHQEDFEASKFTHKLQVELPNSEIYKFRGQIVQENDEKIALNYDNLLLRGCIIRNTDYVEGIVIYAGHETKAMLNNRGPRYKRSKLEHKLNRDVIWCVILLLFLCFFCAIGSGIWLSEYDLVGENTNLVPFISFGDLDQYSPLYQGFIVFWTYIIIFQAVIPLPLYVSVELVKLGQIYFINQDLELYHEESDRRIECRALNITEDLGQVQYIFSDKTGTLTENKMEFKSCSIGGVDYPHLPDESDSENSYLDSRNSMASMSRCSSMQENLNLEPALQREMSNMCLRSLDSVELVIPEHVKRVQEFFLLMTVCNTVVVTHHEHKDKMDASGFVEGEDKGRINPPVGFVHERYRRLSESPSSTPSSRFRVRSSTVSLNPSDNCETQSEGSISSSCLSDVSFNMRYEAESPDELALVKAASAYGCRLWQRSPEKVAVYLPAEGRVDFEVLKILQFDTIRKRMSVILKHPRSGEITLYTKGADSSILSILNRNCRFGENKLQKDKTVEHLTSYAMKGLRTLCMAKRVLSEKEYLHWVKGHREAEASIDDREKLIMESVCRIEYDLELLGATGIEDKLQEGVPEAIATLREAGINIWVLTGDKQETAIQIAYASHLIDEKQELIILNANNEEQAKSLIEHHIDQIAKDRSNATYALIIDGKTLAFALHQNLETQFLVLSQKCNSVMCCRATPIQKGNVVKMVRDHLKKLTLAIGDGANDVSMIQTADIGVGISGQEGMQAVMSSDFAIARFKFLVRLLLVHGHWSYDRLGKFAAYMFYKSLGSVFVIFWYQLFSGFSGSLQIDSIYLLLQHVLFTSLPPLINGVFDKDIDADILLAKPHLYKTGIRDEMYTQWTFLVSTLDGMYQSCIIYFIPHLAYSGHTAGIWEMGSTMCTCMILTQLLHMGLETTSWIWLQWVTLVLSFLFFWIFAIISNLFFFTWDHPSNPYWVMENTISQPIHSCTVILTCVLALLPRFSLRALQGTLFPSEILREKQLNKETTMENDPIGTVSGIVEEQQNGNITSQKQNGVDHVKIRHQNPSFERSVRT